MQVAGTAFSKGDPVPAWVVPIEVQTTPVTGPIIGRIADTQIMVAATPAAYVRSATTVNDASLLSRAGQIAIMFVPEYQRLHLHSVTVIRDGVRLDRTEAVNPRFIQSSNNLDRSLYTDDVIASLLVSDLRIGDTLEYEYTISGQNPVFGGRFATIRSWDEGQPLEIRRIVVTHPAERKIDWRMVGPANASRIEPIETRDGNWRRLEFRENGVKEVMPETATPEDYPVGRRLELSEFASWNVVAEWALDLFASIGEMTPEFTSEVARLKALAGDEERVVSALEFVQSEIRYFAVALGQNSHRPTAPRDVLARRYGDCKDKSLLLSSLLNAAGIKAEPVLLSVAMRKGLRASLSSPLLFDHAIVRVTLKGKTHFLDPARLGQHGRLDRLGQPYGGFDALVIAPGTSALLTIADAGSGLTPASELIETARLAEFTGEAELTSRQVWRGLSAEKARVGLQQTSVERIAQSFGETMAARYPKARVVGEPLIADDRQLNTFSITTRYSVPDLAMQQNGTWVIRFSAKNLNGTLQGRVSPDRSAPLLLDRHPFNGRYSFEVTLPETVSARFDPFSYEVNDKHFKYAQTASFRGNVAKQTVQLQTLADRVAVADLASYNASLDKMAKGLGRVIVVPKQLVRSTKIARASFEQIQAERQKQEVARTTQLIGGGKLVGEQLAAAYALRSGAYLNLQRPAEGLRDAEKAAEIAPSSVLAQIARGDAYWRRGDYARGIAHYSSALTLAPDDAVRHGIHRSRGIAHLQAGNLIAANADFLKASTIGSDADRLMSELWLATSYRRLGQALPAGLVERAAAEPEGDWPRPVLAMLAGTISPERLAAIIEAKTGDDRHMAGTEGYYFLAQYHLTAGDNDLARAYLARVIDLKVFGYEEHTAAQNEVRAAAAQAGVAAKVPAAKPTVDPARPAPSNSNVQTGSLPPHASKGRKVVTRKSPPDLFGGLWGGD